MKKFLSHLNLLPTFLLCVYPLLLIAMAVFFIMNQGFNYTYLVLAIGTYYCANISIGVGVHRLWAHGAYKAKDWVQYVLALISAGTLQGPALAWASDHYKHHTYTDKDGDPHSPLLYTNKFKGFLWAHMGWMMWGELNYKQIDRITLKKLGRNKAVMWQFKHYWKIAFFMNVLLPSTIGYVIFGNLAGAIGAFIFMGLARALQQQVTFCVNSLCHFVGKKTYYDGTARDIWWMFMFLLGENWHNFHHAFARDYRNGVKWYHPDVHKWIIAGMEKLGLASELVRTPKERIAAKLREVENGLLITTKQKVEAAFEKAKTVSQVARQRLQQYEESASSSAKGALSSAKSAIESAKGAMANAREDAMDSARNITDNITENVLVRLKELEALANEICRHIEEAKKSFGENCYNKVFHKIEHHLLSLEYKAECLGLKRSSNNSDAAAA